MDERRTLALLGWTVGGIVGLMFLLNAIALASLQNAPAGKALALVSQTSRSGGHGPSLASKGKGSS